MRRRLVAALEKALEPFGDACTYDVAVSMFAVVASYTATACENKEEYRSACMILANTLDLIFREMEKEL